MASQEQQSLVGCGETGGTVDSSDPPEWLRGGKEKAWESSSPDDSLDDGWKSGHHGWNGWAWKTMMQDRKDGWQEWKGAKWGSDQGCGNEEDDEDEHGEQRRRAEDPVVVVAVAVVGVREAVRRQQGLAIHRTLPKMAGCGGPCSAVQRIAAPVDSDGR